MMVDRVILFENADGTVQVGTPTTEAIDILRNAGNTVAQALDIIADVFQAKADDNDPLKTATKRGAVLASSIPSRRFRKSWRMKAGKAAVDIPEARKERMAELRRERNQKLDDTDRDMMRATERSSGDEATLKATRQALRDMPTTFTTDLALLDTAAKLDNYTPTWPGA